MPNMRIMDPLRTATTSDEEVQVLRKFCESLD